MTTAFKVGDEVQISDYILDNERFSTKWDNWISYHAKDVKAKDIRAVITKVDAKNDYYYVSCTNPKGIKFSNYGIVFRLLDKIIDLDEDDNDCI